MEEIISPLVKLLSNTVMVHVYSYPNFSMETILSLVVCVAHLLLIFEVNMLYRRTNARAAAKLRMRHPIKDAESCSYHTLSHFHQTQVFPNKIETTTTKQSFYVPYKRINRKMSTASNFGWVISHGADSALLRHSFNDRVEHLLAISPSEYVRKEKEKKHREAGLRTCIQSLTSLLEKALNNDNLELQDLSRETLKKSIKSIRDNFDSQISSNTGQLYGSVITNEQGNSSESEQRGDYDATTVHRLIAHSYHRRNLRKSLHAPLTQDEMSMGNKYSEGDDKDDQNDNISDCSGCQKSLDDLCVLYEDNCVEVIHAGDGDEPCYAPSERN